MFSVEDNRKKVERALLVGIQLPSMAPGEGEELLRELTELVENLDIQVMATTLVNLRAPQSRYLVGTGKAEEILAHAREIGADVIVFDEDLSPAQQRNWEAFGEICVIDRQEVILDIFAERAQTREAVLQVGLARMEYSLPRLKRAWTHLSRQRGGGTGARGQGETQLEEDRRLVNQRIAQLRRNLKEVVQQRDVQRRRRLKKPVPTASIVGYTNAGKSSLLNRLTASTVLAEDKLFATLDPTTRQLELPDGQVVLLTDTVGFVRRLPHALVEAFKATLEEVVHADFLIHVLDVTHPEVRHHFETTLSVLRELGADTKRTLTVFNKVDRLEDRSRIEQLRSEHPGALFISALRGEGLDELTARCLDLLAETSLPLELLIPHDRYDIISRLHRSGGIRSQDMLDEGLHLRGVFPAEVAGLVKPYIVKNGRPQEEE
ncbi:MAG: GTPase HflX [Puniceicoccaceae bacterium]|nr:MAG: GTPase HflX [Puniceicoccaceae bacterium]